MRPLIYVAISPALSEQFSLPEQLDRVKHLADVEHWPGPKAPPLEAVVPVLRRAQVVVTGWNTPSLSVALADWSPQEFAVRLIAHSAGTVKALLPLDAVQRGLAATHANEALAESVADFTLGAMLAGRRQMFASAARLRSGGWRLPLHALQELRGSTVGVIGASSIGRRVMRLLDCWDVTLLLYDPYCDQAVAAEYGARLVSLDELLRRSDIVSLHAPKIPATIGMIGAAQLAMMKDGALLINTARGALIDPQSLLAELRHGRISAILDVTDPDEPLPVDSPFFALENCVVLPHIGALTVQACRRQGQYTVDEILRFLTGEPLRYRIDPERWDRMA